MRLIEIRQAGIRRTVPSVEIAGRTVLATGRLLKIASVEDADWLEGSPVPYPEAFLAELRASDLRADVFTFTQRPDDPVPHYSFAYEWENVAAIPLVSYDDWWNHRVSTDLRCDVRKAARRGVEVRSAVFDDDFVRGIVGIYDETPLRQGRRFWHYRCGFDAAKAANATYLDRSEFLGAYLGTELIGFLKIVYVDRLARLMQIIAKDAHREKRPMNALLAKAVELCAARGCSHLTYGKYRYAQGSDSVTAFKHRNGFEEIRVPQYFVPLTLFGKLALRLRLQHGIKPLLPKTLVRRLKSVRASLYGLSPLSRRTA